MLIVFSGYDYPRYKPYGIVDMLGARGILGIPQFSPFGENQSFGKISKKEHGSAYLSRIDATAECRL